jgi:hypothetical protein
MNPRSHGLRVRFFLLALMVLPCVTTCVYGTTVVAIRAEPNRVVIAADSVAIADGKPAATCNIRVVRKVVVAIAGIVSDPKSEFDAFAVAEKSVVQSHTLRGAADQFARAGVPELRKALFRLRRDEAELYEAGIRRNPQALQAVFGGVQDGIVQYTIAYFSVSDAADGGILVSSRRESCPGSACPSTETTDINVLGENAAVARASPGRSTALGSEAVAIAQALVKTEISNSPMLVGAPISTIVVTDGDPVWVEKGLCKP